LKLLRKVFTALLVLGGRLDFEIFLVSTRALDPGFCLHFGH
jgi:hypothetical protein